MKLLRIFCVILCAGLLSGCAITPPPIPEGCEDSFVWQHYYETNTGLLLIKGALVYWVSENNQYKQDVLVGLRELRNLFGSPDKLGSELLVALLDKVDWLNTTAGSSAFFLSRDVVQMLQVELPIHPCDRNWAVDQLDSLIQRIEGI